MFIVCSKADMEVELNLLHFVRNRKKNNWSTLKTKSRKILEVTVTVKDTWSQWWEEKESMMH